MLTVNESGTNVIKLVAVWEIPGVPLETVSIFWFLYIFKIFKVSAPILILLPAETLFGTLETYISVVNPIIEAGISERQFAVYDVTPIL